MDSHKLNMYAGAVIGSLLLFLLLGFFSDLIFVGSGHSEHEPLAFAVEVEEAETAHEEAETDFAALVAAADLAKGEKLFGKCKACHKIEDGVNGVGPNLWGIVGRDIASIAGYAYSGSLSDMEGDWNLETLQAFLESPKGMAADTKMSFKGLPKVEDRVSLIVYLNEAGGSPIELAMAAGGEAESAETEQPAAEATTEMAATTETAATAEAEPEPVTQSEPAAEASTETASAESAETEQPAVAGGDDFAALLAAADAKAGKKVFRKCRACHGIEEGKKGVGPTLWGVVGRDVASIEGYKYSDALMGKDGNWTGTDLFAYIENPNGFLPGTKMTFPGLKDAQDRANVIIFMNEADGSPDPLQ